MSKLIKLFLISMLFKSSVTANGLYAEFYKERERKQSQLMLEKIAFKSIYNHEGYSEIEYLDTKRIRTVGIGRNLVAHPITDYDNVLKEQYIKKYGTAKGFKKYHELFSKRQIKKSIEILSNSKKIDFNKLSFNRKVALIDMYYNLDKKFFRFQKMIDALNKKDYDLVCIEMKNSLWYDEVGQRSRQLIKLMGQG